MTKIILLIHTGDGSQWVWPHWHRYWLANWRGGKEIETVWLSELAQPGFAGVQSIQAGTRPWSRQLIIGLRKIDAKYVIYHHEDYFITEPADTKKLLGFADLMDQHNMNLLKICGDWMGYVDQQNLPTDSGIRYGQETIWLYNNNSQYLVSHQSSIWNREFLISTLIPWETPWQHELNGTDRLRNRNVPLHAYCGYPPIIYQETVNHGKIRETAKELFKE